MRKSLDVLYWIGVQNGSTDIANFAPRIDMGIVEPSIAMSTAGNCISVSELQKKRK